jgi:hypothetical protein
MPAQHRKPIPEAEIARRATQLLSAFFTNHPNLRQAALDRAFAGHAKDPRGLIEISPAADIFATECVNKLLAYGCTDGHRHSLARLIEVIRDDFPGANPDPDYIELPRWLNTPCALPSRAEERAHLERLLADIRRKADLYAPLCGIACLARKRAADPVLAAWEDLAPLRHVRRSRSAPQEPESRDFGDILSAFGQVKRAALLGRPGAGKTLLKLATDLATRTLAEPDTPLPLLVRLGDWTGRESLDAFLANHLPGVGDAVVPLSRRGRLEPVRN